MGEVESHRRRPRAWTDGRVDGAAPRDEGRSPPSPWGAEGRGAADDAKRGIRAERGELVLRGRRLRRALCRNGLPSCDIAPRPGDGIGAAFHKSRPGKTPVATSAPSNGRGGVFPVPKWCRELLVPSGGCTGAETSGDTEHRSHQAPRRGVTTLQKSPAGGPVGITKHKIKGNEIK